MGTQGESVGGRCVAPPFITVMNSGSERLLWGTRRLQSVWLVQFTNYLSPLSLSQTNKFVIGSSLTKLQFEINKKRFQNGITKFTRCVPYVNYKQYGNKSINRLKNEMVRCENINYKEFQSSLPLITVINLSSLWWALSFDEISMTQCSINVQIKHMPCLTDEKLTW